ncbi:MAG: response regulator [Candidatus Gastranaerophilales bacterium]|nr:response regulator [Candidatus Gastranaerophilales bacterium]
MQLKTILILDKRQEMSVKYKKILQQDFNATVEIFSDIQSAYESLKDIEPDLILISDSIEENLADICKKIRITIKNYRPVIISLSKSAHLADKLNALKYGADDFISEPIDITEFSARIFAHYRRYIEDASNYISKLPAESFTYKTLRHILKSNNLWSLVFIDIDNFKHYHTLYGHLASEKMLKAFSAILKTSVDENDFLGNVGEDNFIIITNPLKAQKIAFYLNYAFDSIASKFYSEEDSKRGYIILNGEGKVGCKIPLVSISMGIISNEHRNYESFEQVITHARNIHNMAKSKPGSSFLCDLPKISVDNSIIKKNDKKKIIIFEKDAALAYLLVTTLELQGFEVQAISNKTEIMDLCVKFVPNLVIYDIEDNDFSICQKIKHNKEISHIKLITSTTSHNKEEALTAGADLYLPKPYELITLFTWINRLLNS